MVRVVFSLYGKVHIVVNEPRETHSVVEVSHRVFIHA